MQPSSGPHQCVPFGHVGGPHLPQKTRFPQPFDRNPHASPWHGSVGTHTGQWQLSLLVPELSQATEPYAHATFGMPETFWTGMTARVFPIPS